MGQASASAERNGDSGDSCEQTEKCIRLSDAACFRAQVVRRCLDPVSDLVDGRPCRGGADVETEPGVPLRSPVGVRSSTPGYRLSPLPGRALVR